MNLPFDALPPAEGQLWGLILFLDHSDYPQTKECMRFIINNYRHWLFLQGYTHKVQEATVDASDTTKATQYKDTCGTISYGVGEDINHFKIFHG